MQQGIKFTQDLGQMAWFLQVPWFDVTHIDKHTQDTEGLTQIYIYINNTCYMHTTATGITLNLLIPKISLRGLQCLCFQKLFSQRNHVSADSIHQELSPSCETLRILIETM